MAEVLSVLEVKELADEDETDLGVLVDLSDLLDDAEDGLKVFSVFEHPYKDILQVFLEKILGLLCSFVLPLNDLMPNRPSKLNHLYDEVEHCLCLAGHYQ